MTSTIYQLRVGPISLHFSGPRRGRPCSNTVLYVGRVVVAPRYADPGEAYRAYVEIEPRIV
jgi:hypothetical protein